MTGGGEPSVAEVATSLPARLLGAIKNCKSSQSTLSKRGRRRWKDRNFSEKGRSFSVQPDRAFIGQSAPETRHRKGAHAAVPNLFGTPPEASPREALIHFH